MHFARAHALGVDCLAIGAASIERVLGAPVVPAAAQPLAGDIVELGLTPLEEEVLQDEIDEAQRAFATLVGRWRTSVPLTTLDTLRRRAEDTGVGIASVTWPELARWSDEEIDYAFRATRTLGASVVTTPMSLGLARRLGPFADRHAARLGILGQVVTGASDFEAALGHGAMVGAAIDTADWTAGRHGPLLPFLERYADRITHVRLRDCTATGRLRRWVRASPPSVNCCTRCATAAGRSLRSSPLTGTDDGSHRQPGAGAGLLPIVPRAVTPGPDGPYLNGLRLIT